MFKYGEGRDGVFFKVKTINKINMKNSLTDWLFAQNWWFFTPGNNRKFQLIRVIKKREQLVDVTLWSQMALKKKQQQQKQSK